MKCVIYLSHLNKFTKQFIPVKKIRNNKKVKPKWMNKEIKRLIRETKTNSSEENQQRYREPLQSKKGEIRESKKIM